MSLVAPRGMDRVTRRLVEVLAPQGSAMPPLAPLHVAQPPARVSAIDGSSVVLGESGEHLLAAFRAGLVGVEKGAPTPAKVPAPEIVLLTPDDARATLAERLETLGYPAHGLPRMDVSSVLDALRTLEEMQVALGAVEDLDEGDLLLIDGALQVRPHVPLIDRVLARAHERGVDVVGVCKSTSITLGAAPALVACTLAGRAQKTSTWHAPLPAPANVRGATYAARLSPAEERAFRFDVVSRRPAAEVLAGVSGLCGHPAYPGYPSPLAMAHNAVLLDDATRRRLLAEVQERALAAGVDARAWDAAFVDYHDILEIGA